MKKRFLALALVGTLAAGVLAGCGSDSKKEDKKDKGGCC